MRSLGIYIYSCLVDGCMCWVGWLVVLGNVIVTYRWMYIYIYTYVQLTAILDALYPPLCFMLGAVCHLSLVGCKCFVYPPHMFLVHAVARPPIMQQYDCFMAI